jgi:hypothetical protein
VGAIDLWGDDGYIYDFKTTRGLWSQARAQTEVWQPALYTQARWLEEPGYGGEFEYIVLNRVTGTLQRFTRDWTRDDVVSLWNDVWEKMQVITTDIRLGHFVCSGNHGYCPECGDRWAHDHACSLTTGRARVHAD